MTLAEHDIPNLRKRLEIAKETARIAAPVAMSYFRSALEITSKTDASPVTVADRNTEQTIRAALQDACPGETIFGEEFGQQGAGTDMWIVDPIDGTRSFVAGFPLFGTLIGYYAHGEPQIGVISMPALGEVFTGARGLGATFNGETIHTSTCGALADARLFINEADKLGTTEPEIWTRLISAGASRRMAADCYPHALVASGHADAVVDYGLQPYDYLPVAAVVEAAGGVITDWQGNPLTFASDGRTVTAATPELHEQILGILNK